MKIAVTSTGQDLSALMSPIFGRCEAFVLIDSDTLAFDVIANPAVSAAGGAGIQAAQYVVQQGVEAIITGNLGPNAHGVLAAANVPTYLCRQQCTVSQAVEAFKAGELQTLSAPNVGGHYGTGGGRGTGRGGGRGLGRGV